MESVLEENSALEQWCRIKLNEKTNNSNHNKKQREKTYQQNNSNKYIIAECTE